MLMVDGAAAGSAQVIIRCISNILSVIVPPLNSLESSAEGSPGNRAGRQSATIIVASVPTYVRGTDW